MARGHKAKTRLRMAMQRGHYVELAPVEQTRKPGRASQDLLCAAGLRIPTHVVESYIEAYVVYAVQMLGGFTVAEMENRVFETELRADQDQFRRVTHLTSRRAPQ